MSSASANLFPFSRKLWNEEIIQPINSLCENPPDGCDPIDPLDEAERDHIWRKQDVQDVHDKLRELCEDNEFDELETPQLDYKTLIEEIEEAIIQGWCNCEPEIIELGTLIAKFLSHSNIITQCCGIIDERYAGFGFCRIWTTTTYHSSYNDEWTPDESQQGKLDERLAKFREAKTETFAWAEDREQELLAERFAKQLRDILASQQEALQNAQNALAACVEDCADEQDTVDLWQGRVDETQQELDIQEANRDEAKTKAEEHLTNADAAATRNWEIMIGEQYLNRVAFIAGVTNYGVDFLPNTLDMVTLMGIGNKPWGMGPYPFDFTPARTVLFVHKDEVQVGGVGVRYTPTGLPFASWNKHFILDVPYTEWSFSRDESTYPPTCPPLDPAEVGDFARKVAGWGALEIDDAFKFSKREDSGTSAITYDDL